MSLKQTLRVRERDTQRWVIWNHQTYMLAHDVREVCMGAYVAPASMECADRLLDRIREQLSGSFEIAVVDALVVDWCKPVPLRR